MVCEQSKELKKKIVILGDFGVGKTSILRHACDLSNEECCEKLGVRLAKRRLEIERSKCRYIVELIIWDILSHQKLSEIYSRHISSASGALMVCDITKKETLENLESYWIPLFNGGSKHIPMVFLANKCDLRGRFTAKELENLASKYGAAWFLTAAKTGKNIDKAFRELGKIFVTRNKFFNP